MTWALVFPGQGSQAVGMGRDLAAAYVSARETFEEVDDALGQALSRLMFDGPEDALTLTENAQPALMAVSVAAVRALTREGGLDLAARSRCAAGHSLGEYSALCATGALTLADTARLLRRRGRAMQDAVPVGVGAMAALIGADLEVATEIATAAAGDEVCTAANDNAPGQVVISGHAAAIDRAIAIAAERGLKRAVKLAVSAPFHCPLMAPAAAVMADALAATRIDPPVVPVVTNVTAAPAADPDEHRRLLVEQVTALVRWRESVEFMVASGVTTLVEVGAGKVLTGLARRIDRELTGRTAGTAAELEALVKEL